MADHDGTGRHAGLYHIFLAGTCARPMIRSAIVRSSVPRVLYNCMPNAVEIKINVGRDDALRLIEDVSWHIVLL
jgi:hypothetical protein